MALEVTDENLSSVLLNKKITVLDFWAEWCGPCRVLSPIMDEISTEFENDNTITIGKVNVDENSDSALKYGIRNIPTLLFLKNGKVVDKVVGLQSKSQILEKINNLVE